MGDVVLYHANCPDGFGAAYAAWTVLGDAAIYRPVNYGQPVPPEAESGADRLFLLDFSYPRATLGRLAGPAREILVLDHHKTARDELAGLPYARFDMDRSGAVLAWEHFHPDEPVPLLLLYVQDRDLWRWTLPDSREVSAALASYDRDFATWHGLIRATEQEGHLDLAAEGESILRAQAKHVASLCNRAFPADVGGHRVPTVNSPLYQSEVGEELCKRHPEAPFAAIFSVGDGDEIWSLRSRNGFDVSAVAKALGGGGHPAAAGFRRVREGG